MKCFFYFMIDSVDSMKEKLFDGSVSINSSLLEIRDSYLLLDDDA